MSLLIKNLSIKGNENNFKTQKECESECGLSKEAGEFNIMILKFYKKIFVHAIQTFIYILKS